MSQQTSPARTIGAQSWCYRNAKPVEVLAEALQKDGFDRVELCGVHADFNDPATHAETIAALRERGIDIVSIGVQTFTGDMAKERQWCEFVKQAGARHISAHFNVDSFQRAVPVAATLAECYDLRIAIHCHGGYRFNGSFDELRHLLDIGGERIGLCLDAAWCLQAGADPVDWVEKFAGRIYGVHYKDFLFEPNGKWTETVVGEGCLDLSGFVKALEKHDFDGYAVMEYEAAPDNPGPALLSGRDQILAV